MTVPQIKNVIGGVTIILLLILVGVLLSVLLDPHARMPPAIFVVEMLVLAFTGSILSEHARTTHSIHNDAQWFAPCFVGLAWIVAGMFIRVTIFA